MLQKMSSNTKKTASQNIMSLNKMGSRYPSRLSFSRSMLRTMIKEKWRIKRVKFDLDKYGYGTVVYEVKTPKHLYSLICFSQYLADTERSDRVIAEKWDTAYTLHIGKISSKDFVVPIPGAATTAAYISFQNFLYNKILIINTGYYSLRWNKLIRQLYPQKKIFLCDYEKINNFKKKVDWIIFVYAFQKNQVRPSCPHLSGQAPG